MSVASSADVTPAPEPARSSTRLGRYRLCFEIASGGMGTVYLARAEGPAGFEKLVALKRIHEHLAKDPRFVAMFLDEARIAARIHHPNVCGVIDFGCVHGSYYLTMPFVVGESLHGVVRAASRREEPEFASRFVDATVRIVADACEGLHAAHELRDERGELEEVVHRDVSPQNLLVGYDGAVRVLDFGVASARHRLHSTATGEVKGKFAYLAPEQIEGQPVDRRADVWALGVVLYECLARRRLFSRKTMAETVQAVLHGAIPPLSEVAPHVPLALEEVVFKALARDPERRYATARDMGRDLLAFLAEDGRVVGPGDVAELLHTLFPNAADEKRRLLDEAPASAMAIASEPTPDEPTLAEVATVADVPPARTPRLAVAFVAFVALGVGAGGAWLLARSSSEAAPAATVVATPAPASPEESPPVRRPEPVPTAPVAPRAVTLEPAEAPPVEPAARADREPRRAGSVSVVTPGGWAIVYRGRQRVGEAPGTFDLPAGQHVLRIQPFGRGDVVRRTVRVLPGETVRVSVRVR